ncbi:MAG: hypothetical protein ACXADC_13840 [Candidatus Thorarchaeota archaeon]|jgi:hypothetical protein
MTLDPHFTDLGIDEKNRVVESLGLTVQEGQGARFEKLLRQMNLSGTINVTDWTPEAVRILLSIGREEELALSLRNRDRYYTVVKYPEGPLLSVLIRSIVLGEW